MLLTTIRNINIGLFFSLTREVKQNIKKGGENDGKFSFI